MAGLTIPPHVLASLAARGGPGAPPPDPTMLPGGAPVGPPGAAPPGLPPGVDPSGGPGLPVGAPADPSTPDGAIQLITPLVLAQQQQLDGIKQAQAQSMAQAMAQAMQNLENPAGAAAATLPGVPTAPGSDPGGPDQSMGGPAAPGPGY